MQDIYPPAPLQEGILFHHLLEKAGDVYLLAVLFSLDSRERVSGASGQAWTGIEFLEGQERTNYPLSLSIDDLGEQLNLSASTSASIDPARV